MIRRASLRTRLAVLYAGLAVIVLAISLLTVYAVARRDALNRVDSSLRTDAHKLGSRTEAAEHGNGQESDEQIVNAREAVGSGHLLALYDDQRVIASSAEARDLIVAAQRMGLFSGRERVATVTLASGRFRVSAVPNDRGEYAVAAAPLQPVLESMEGLLNATLLAGVVGVLLTSVGAWFAARRGLQPLESITALANEVAPDAMGLRTGLDKGDEIGAVAAAIDRMLSRLETAFDAQKRFLEDASHELRTPLTIARGHLELISKARMPRPSSASRRSPSRLTRSTAWAGWSRDCCSWLGRARSSVSTSCRSPSSRCSSRSPPSCPGWATRAWTVPPPPSSGDGFRRRGLPAPDRAEPRAQCGRAQPWTPVELGRAAWIGSRDRGRRPGTGIDPQIRGRVFDRFAHDGDGIGLGLAISKALAEAQKGKIILDDRPGGGTLATVTLPAAP